MADLLVSRPVGLMAYLSAVRKASKLVELTAYPSVGYLAYQLAERMVYWLVDLMAYLSAARKALKWVDRKVCLLAAS